MDKPDPTNLAAALGGLRPKEKAPASARILDGWIAQAERQLGSNGGRLGWLVASTVVAAALQQAVDMQGEPLLLIKGGTLLQHRLPRLSGATTDLDGLVKGDLDGFIEILDEVLAQPWGPCTLRRNPVEVIQVPNCVVKPRRFDIIVQVNGATWRRIQVEVSPDEGSAGAQGEPLPAPSLAGFGLPTPDHLTGLAMRYQIAQKIHAASDPHNPPAFQNDRARDVVDLLLYVTSSAKPAPRPSPRSRQPSLTCSKPAHTTPPHSATPNARGRYTSRATPTGPPASTVRQPPSAFHSHSPRPSTR